jgi:hypothetical protein
MENASGAFLDAVRKSMRQIRTAVGASVIDPSLLTSAEKLQYEGYVRREEANAAILSSKAHEWKLGDLARHADPALVASGDLSRDQKPECLPKRHPDRAASSRSVSSWSRMAVSFNRSSIPVSSA